MDYSSSLASRLRYLMEQRNHISEAELARATSLPQPTVHRLITGETQDPRISTLTILANYFEVTLDYLLAPHTTTSSSKSQSVPIIAWNDILGFFSDRKNILATHREEEWASTELSLSNDAFALYSRPAMEPRFPRGTLLFIDPAATLQDGDLVLVAYDNQQIALRGLLLDGDRKILHSVVSAQDPEPINKSKRILGVLMQSKFTFHNL